MKIFDKRPLSLILCVMLGGFVFFSFSDDSKRIIIPTIALLVLLSSFFIFKEERGRRILMRICGVALLVSSLLSYIYFDLYFFAHERFTGDVTIVGTIEEIDHSTNPKTLLVSTDSINDAAFSSYDIEVSLTSDQSINLSVGSSVRIVGELSGFEKYSSFDIERYKISQGISSKISEVKEIELIEVGDFTLKNKISAYRESLCRKMILNSDREGGGFLSAFLLGERSYLSPQLQLDFSRIGITHILALSGMHITVLAFLIDKILSFFGIKKKPRKVTEIAFIVLYMFLTGFPSSVVRAGLMLIIASLLYLFSAKHDSVTTVSISTFIICLFNPTAIYDMGLWLSAFATLGILVLSEMKAKNYAYERKSLPVWRRILTGAAKMLLSTVFAIGATTFISAFTFRTTSVISFIATPIFALITDPLIYLGFIFLLFGGILPFGGIITWFGKIISSLASSLASIDGIFVSTDFALVDVLVIAFSVAFFAFLILEIKHKKIAISLISLLLCSIYASSLFISANLKSDVALNYTASGNDERIFLQSESGTTIIDATGTSAKSTYDSIEYINGRKLTELDSYIFTDYSQNLPDAVYTLLSRIKVDKVYVPSPITDSEFEIQSQISEIRKTFSAEIIEFDQSHVFRESKFTIFPVYRSGGKVAFTIKYNDDFYTYLSTGMLKGNEKAVAESLINGSHTLILGNHGKSYSNGDFIYLANDVNTIIFSSDNLYVPSDVVEYYKDTELLFSPEAVDLIR